MMKRILQWTLVILIAFVLQGTIMQAIRIGGIMPDLLVVVLFILSMKHGAMIGIYVGFMVGLGQDLYSPSVLGQNALAKSTVGIFVGLFNDRVLRTDPLLKGVLLIAAFLLHDSFFYGAQLLKNDQSMNLLFKELAIQTLPRALFSSVFAALFFFWDTYFKPAFRP